VESVTLPDMEVEQTRYAGMPVMKKEIQTTIPEESYQPEETVAREVREIWEEPVVSKEKEIQEIEEATVILREKEIEEIKEALAGFTKKMDLIVNNMTEISLTLKELKDAISIIQSEVKDAKKEQKGVETHLREITDTLDNIKAKKRWFSFSYSAITEPFLRFVSMLLLFLLLQNIPSRDSNRQRYLLQPAHMRYRSL